MFEENMGFNDAEDGFDPRDDNHEGSVTKVSELSPSDLELLDTHMQRWYGDDQDLTIPLDERRQQALDEIPDLMETLRENAGSKETGTPTEENIGPDEHDELLHQHQYIRGYGPGAEQSDNLTWDKLSPEDLAMLDEYVNAVETDSAPLEERRNRVLENVAGIMDMLRMLHEKDPTRDPMLEETDTDWAHVREQLRNPIRLTEWDRLSKDERELGTEMLTNMQKAGLYTDEKNRPLPFAEAMEQMLSDYPGSVQEQAKEKRIAQSLGLEKPTTQGLTKTMVLDTVLDPRRTMGPCLS